MTYAITYPNPGSIATLTSVSTTTDTVTTISVSTVTTSSAVNLSASLASAYLSHIGAIESQNATTLAAQYETNATLITDGYRFGSSVNATYHGVGNITSFYAENPCSICSLPYGVSYPNSHSVANQTYSAAYHGGDTGSVTSSLVLYAGGSCCYPIATTGVYYYAVSFEMTYVLQGDRWLISTESQTAGGGDFCTTYSFAGSTLYCTGTPPS